MSRRNRKSTEQLHAELVAMTAKRRGLTETAERLEFSVPFIWDVVNGKRGITEELAKRMGYRRVVEYERTA